MKFFFENIAHIILCDTKREVFSFCFQVKYLNRAFILSVLIIIIIIISLLVIGRQLSKGCLEETAFNDKTVNYFTLSVSYVFVFYFVCNKEFNKEELRVNLSIYLKLPSSTDYLTLNVIR